MDERVTTSLRPGDRVVDADGLTGTVEETGIRMRDYLDRPRIAVKLYLDPTDDFPHGISGAYRYLDTVQKIDSGG